MITDLIARPRAGRRALTEAGQPDAAEKNGGACGAAKFREETSKKADSATRGRIAAMHNLGDRSFACKRYFRNAALSAGEPIGAPVPTMATLR